MRQRLPDKITIGEKYGPAMAIIEQAAADEYFEVLVEHTMRFGKSRKEAEKIERMNLGYYAGYGFDRERVERLFRCSHPVFGPVSNPVTTDQALLAGCMKGAEVLRRS